MINAKLLLRRQHRGEEDRNIVDFEIPEQLLEVLQTEDPITLIAQDTELTIRLDASDKRLYFSDVKDSEGHEKRVFLVVLAKGDNALEPIQSQAGRATLDLEDFAQALDQGFDTLRIATAPT